MAVPPFFVVGFQRSGTTLLRLMLDNHPAVAIPLDVTGLWARYDESLARYGDLRAHSARRALVDDLLREDRICLWGVPLSAEEVLSRWEAPGLPGVIEAFYRSYARAKGKTRWGDKDPGNLLRVHQLSRWFPSSQIVHLIRDGRGACVSHLSQSFGFSDVLECADAWREQVWWVRRIGELLGPTRYAEVKYEDLVREPRQQLTRLCQFLDLPFDPVMLDYHQHVPQSIPESKRHIWPLIDEPPRPENAQRWRQQMSPGVRVCFAKRAGRLLQELGYDVDPPPWRGAYLAELRSLLGRGLRAVKRRLAPSRVEAP